jgi:hypothetical protein
MYIGMKLCRPKLVECVTTSLHVGIREGAGIGGIGCAYLGISTGSDEDCKC